MDLKLANQLIITKLIKPRMEERGLTIYALGKISGVNRSIIGRWFSGEMNITLNNLMKIISALDINIQFVYKEDDSLPYNYIHEN